MEAATIAEEAHVLKWRGSTVLAAILLLLMAMPAGATGQDICQPLVIPAYQQGEFATSGGFLIGARATIEGQGLPLCNQIVASSGSFHWAALTYVGVHPEDNIIQVGYGHCLNTNNGIGLGQLCNGSFYWYWAWGSNCGNGRTGSGGSFGPVAIRIGSSIANPPTSDYYVLREFISGAYYYSAYVNGQLLQGIGADGLMKTARVAAGSVCWNSFTGSSRQLYWFGETFNDGDSMGGWVGTTQNHLDHDPLRYSYNTGWKVPNLPAGTACNADIPSGDPVRTCTIAERDHIYIQTANRD